MKQAKAQIMAEQQFKLRHPDIQIRPQDQDYEPEYGPDRAYVIKDKTDSYYYLDGKHMPDPQAAYRHARGQGAPLEGLTLMIYSREIAEQEN